MTSLRSSPVCLSLATCLAALAFWGPGAGPAQSGELVVILENARQVTTVGVFNRWDQDGNPRVPVDPKAKIDAPAFTATARQEKPGRWVLPDLPAGRYDVVVMAANRVRLEGFHYPPVLEFDEFFKHGKLPAPDARETVVSDIAQSRHYENKVTPLYMSGDDKVIRVLVQLLRDKPTSYDSQYGQQVATLRHEVWQYTNRYGAWSKEKRTRVIDRILMGKRDLRQWTWAWIPELGGVDVSDKGTTTVRYSIPRRLKAPEVKGLLPY